MPETFPFEVQNQSVLGELTPQDKREAVSAIMLFTVATFLAGVVVGLYL